MNLCVVILTVMTQAATWIWERLDTLFFEQCHSHLEVPLMSFCWLMTSMHLLCVGQPESLWKQIEDHLLRERSFWSSSHTFSWNLLWCNFPDFESHIPQGYDQLDCLWAMGEGSLRTRLVSETTSVGGGSFLHPSCLKTSAWGRPDLVTCSSCFDLGFINSPNENCVLFYLFFICAQSFV